MEASLRLDERAFTLPSVREDAVVMVRTLLTLLNTMKKLTLRRVISIKLFYNEDVTPAEYQPTFYTDSTEDNHAFFAAPPLKLTVGKLSSVSARRCQQRRSSYAVDARASHVLLRAYLCLLPACLPPAAPPQHDAQGGVPRGHR